MADPEPKFAYDMFFGRNSKAKPRARKLTERLKVARVRVWLDERVIKPGDMIAPKVDKGPEQSRVLLLCISPNALASNCVALEQSTAVHRDPANAGRRFIPLLLGECGLPDTLRRCKYVDFLDEPEAALTEVPISSRTSPDSKDFRSLKARAVDPFAYRRFPQVIQGLLGA